MPLPAWIGGIFKPVSDLIDELVTSKEEKGQIEVALTESLTAAGTKIMETEQALSAAQASIIIAEAQGESWLQRNWRPLLMAEFGLIIGWNIAIVPVAAGLFGLMIPPVDVDSLPPEMWSVIKLGIGGYIGSRGLEKITATIMQRPEIFKKKKKK